MLNGGGANSADLTDHGAFPAPPRLAQDFRSDVVGSFFVCADRMSPANRNTHSAIMVFFQRNYGVLHRVSPIEISVVPSIDRCGESYSDQGETTGWLSSNHKVIDQPRAPHERCRRNQSAARDI